MAVSTEVAGILQGIAESVGKVSHLVSEVAAACAEQAQGIEQVNAGISGMDKVTQTTAANAEESASASEELSAQARELNDLVGALTALMAGGEPPVAETHRRQDGTGRPAAVSAWGKAARSPVGSKWPGRSPARGFSHGSAEEVQVLASAARRRPPEEVIPLTEEELKAF